MPALTPCQQPATAPSTLRLTDDLLTGESVMAVLRLLKEQGQDRLLLDMAAVRVPTAGGLGALVCLNKELEGRLCLLNVQPRAYEVFELTRLTEVLDVQTACPAPGRGSEV